MSTAPFEDACLRGVKSAFRKHYKFTGGWGLGHAPEAFIQGEIACALSKVCHYVTLESSVRFLLESAGAELRGRSPRKGRIDVATYWASGMPRFLIEVKKVWANESINADTRRLKQVLGRGGASREGLVLVYSDARKPATLEKRFQAISKSSRAMRSAETGAIRYFPDQGDEEYYWAAVCFRVAA